MTLEPARSSPSIISVGAPAKTDIVTASIVALGSPADTSDVIVGASDGEPAGSPSIVALGGPPPPVSSERVAAIPENERSADAPLPTVIRGGLIGDAYSRPAPQPAAQAQSEPAAPESQPRRRPAEPETPAEPAEPEITDSPGPVER